MKPERLKIIVTRPIPGELCDEISRNRPELDIVCRPQDAPINGDELIEWINAEKPYGVVITLAEKFPDNIISKLPESVKAISTIAVGKDNIDQNACDNRGIKVFNTPDVLTNATADLTWALILAASRRIVEGHKMCADDKFVGWSPTLLMGKELTGATIGIVGMGRIGSAVAKRAFGFNMKVAYFNRNPIQDISSKFPGIDHSSLPKYMAIDDLCAQSDVITLHCPLNDASFHLLNEARLNSCRHDAALVNMARGPVVDETALIKSLKAGRFMGVGLDVYENEPNINPELKNFDRVTLLPHIGSATIETRWKMMRLSINAILETVNK